MDPATIALAAAALLAKKALEAVGEDAGKSAWAVLGRIANAIRTRFRGDQEVTESLDRLEAKPASQARTHEVAEVLEERLRADPDFAAELELLLQQAQAAGMQIQEGDAGIVAGGDVTQHAGGDAIGRDKYGGDRIEGDKVTYAPPPSDR